MRRGNEGVAALPAQVASNDDHGTALGGFAHGMVKAMTCDALSAPLEALRRSCVKVADPDGED